MIMEEHAHAHDAPLAIYDGQHFAHTTTMDAQHEYQLRRIMNEDLCEVWNSDPHPRCVVANFGDIMLDGVPVFNTQPMGYEEWKELLDKLMRVDFETLHSVWKIVNVYLHLENGLVSVDELDCVEDLYDQFNNGRRE